MEQRDSKFERVLGKKDVFAIAFGAMIGWGWVVLAGGWIEKAGTLGAILSFVIGGILVLFVGLTYAELTSAMPQCGGEQIFSLRALGPNWSYLCTWAIILSYVGVVAFEACALPTVLDYIIPNFGKGYMYTVEGFDIYGTWVAVGVVSSIALTIVNYLGIKPAAVMQSIFTVVIAVIGVVLMFGALKSGDMQHTKPLFEDGVGGILSVAVMTPFMLMGFDVIPQAAEEIALPFKKIGRIIIISIFAAVLWYSLIILAVSAIMTRGEIDASVLVTADAMKKAFNNSDIMAKVLIIGGMAGILSSWNSFFMGGSRAIYALAEARCLPKFLTKIHPKYKTPTNAVLLIGAISTVAPFFGKAMMEWLTNAGGLGAVLAYMMVSISFLVLRKKEPNLARPYKIKRWKFVGGMAVLLSVGMLILYMPGMPSGLGIPEWTIVGGWALLGVVFYAYAKKKFPHFGRVLNINLEEVPIESE
ncbi:APC family permease [Lachnospiraceae bacterium LCP25S3_G4]